MNQTNSIFLGIDLGQRHDPTALAVVEQTRRTSRRRNPVTFGFDESVEARARLRALKKLRLGMPYPQVVDYIARTARELRRHGRCTLVVDATGVGAPIVDALREADLGGAAVMAVMMTSGDFGHHAHGRFFVPKINLMTGLERCLERGDLEVAAGVEGFGALVEEMRGYGVRLTANANAQYGGKRDDLVVALSLAVWGATMPEAGERREALTW